MLGSGAGEGQHQLPGARGLRTCNSSPDKAQRFECDAKGWSHLREHLLTVGHLRLPQEEDPRVPSAKSTAGVTAGGNGDAHG